jgi:hypothetical protein
VTAPAPRSAGRRLTPTMLLLALAVVALALDSRLPTGTALVVAAAGYALSMGLRATGREAAEEVAPLPVLVALGVLAVETPIAALPELLVGAAGVVFVAWLVDDPSRPPAGLSRGALVWGVPAFAVGIAWASSFLLPSTAASLGVAGALLAGALVTLAYLVSRPDLFYQNEPATI